MFQELVTMCLSSTMEQEELKRMRRLVFQKGSGSKLYDLNLRAWVRNSEYIIYIIHRSIFKFFVYNFWPYLSQTFRPKFLKKIFLFVKSSSVYIFFTQLQFFYHHRYTCFVVGNHLLKIWPAHDPKFLFSNFPRKILR